MYASFFKRIFDFLLSLLALIILSPVLLLLALIGAVAMKGNPFFTQVRPGRIDRKTGKERLFRLIKFRTMSNAKDSEGNLLPDDVRLNRYGKFLRSTSLDELPELLNILIGDMAIVGPRPLLPEYIPYYTERERLRHTVRPGLTGLAQINGRNAIGWDEKLAFDVEYISKITFIGDMKIIFATFGKVFKRSDIQVGSGFKAGKFIDQRRKRMGLDIEDDKQTTKIG